LIFTFLFLDVSLPFIKLIAILLLVFDKQELGVAEGENLVRASVPKDMVGKKLYDANGNCYAINAEDNKGWLGKFVNFKGSRIEGGVESLDALVKKVAQEVIVSWLKKEAVPYITYSALEGEALLAQCILDGERQFRKDFVEKLGAQGAAMWRNILKQQAKAIVKSIHGNNPLKNDLVNEGIVSSGIMPPGGRLKWSGTNGRSIHTLYCIECPPCVRNINIFKKYRRLAFPYVIFMPLFSDGKFIRFFAFYSKEEVKSEASILYLPNLPHVSSAWPFDWCIGGYTQTPELDNPDWHKLVRQMFWDSSFVYNMPGQFCECWLEAIGRIPEVSSVEKWEELSRSSPEKIIQLPWRETGYSVGAYAKKLLIDLGCGKESIGDSAKEKILQDKVESLFINFRDQLQEGLHFLGSAFLVQPSIKASAERFAKDSMSKAGQELSDSFEIRAGDIVKNVLAELGEKTGGGVS